MQGNDNGSMAWVDLRIVDAIVNKGDGTIRNIAIFCVMNASAYFAMLWNFLDQQLHP
jgi:hypothetical protein